MTSPGRSARRLPASYYAPGSWPHGAADADAPLHVLHAAQVAVFVHSWAVEHGRTFADGLTLLAQRSGVPRSTLAHLVNGDRWAGIDVIGRLEWAVGESVTGVEAIAKRAALVALDGKVIHPRLKELREEARERAARPA